MQRVNCLAVESVSLALTVRNVIHDVCADRFEVGIKQSCRSNSVNIVVTVNGYSLKIVDRAAYAVDRLIHINYFERINKFNAVIVKTKHIAYLFICAKSP